MEKAVVVCGAIRQPIEFKLIMSKLIGLRESEIINKIIVSTWVDELKTHGSLKNELLDHGIDIIETSCPEHGGVGNSLRQKKALLSGLNKCPESSLVLKVRTDKCYKIIDQFAEYMKNESLPYSNSTYSCFSKKIVVQDASVAIPFLISDKVFLGFKEDLLLLTDSSANIDSEFCNASTIGAETRWFIEPFLRNYPALRYFYTFFSNRSVSTVFIKSVRNGEIDLFPKQILSYIFLYYRLLSENFCLVDTRKRKNVDEFMDLISTSQNTAFIRVDTRAFREESFFRNQQSLDQAVKFMESEISSITYDIDLWLSDFDIDEINNFNLKYNHQKLLAKPYRIYSGLTRNKKNDNVKTKLVGTFNPLKNLQISAKNAEYAFDCLLSFIDKGHGFDGALFYTGTELVNKLSLKDGEALIQESFNMKYPEAIYYFADKCKKKDRCKSIILLRQSAAKGHKPSQSLLRDLLLMEGMSDEGKKWNSIVG